MRKVKKLISLVMAAAVSAGLLIGVPPTVKAEADTNLKLWYKFEETSGAAVGDASGSGFNGTYVNAITRDTGKLRSAMNPKPSELYNAAKEYSGYIGKSFYAHPYFSGQALDAGGRVPVTDVTIALSMVQGSTATLLATITPVNASNKTVTFSSSNPAAAAVSETLFDPATGVTSVKVNAIAKGNTVISATTADGNKRAVFHITVVSSSEPLGPRAVLSADDRVKPGSSFTVGVSLANVTQNVYAEDITLTYDANVFEYVHASGAGSNIQMVTEDKSTTGKVRLIAANIGGISGAGTPVLDTLFKVKAGVLNTSGTIAVTQAKLGTAPQGTVVEAAPSSKSISISNSEEEVDKAALIAAVTHAQNLYETAAVGTQPGQYPQAAKDAFGAAIRAAKAVKDNANATQIQIDNAVEALMNAEAMFKTAVIKVVSADLNKDESIDVGDLAIAAYHYGKSPISSDWAIAKMADLNGDDMIDIVDIAYIASKILE